MSLRGLFWDELYLLPTLMFVYVADSSKKCFIARQRCRCNTFLRFLGNSQLFYIVDSYM